MKKLLTKLTAALLVCFTVLTMVPASVLQVQAASPKVDKRIDAILYPTDPNMEISNVITIKNPTKNGKFSNVKTDKSILKMKLSQDKKYLMYTPKKAGKAKLSFKYAGKQFRTTVYVTKWENPCSKFIIGKEDLKKYFDRSGNFCQIPKSSKSKKEKVSVTAAPGWEIVSMGTYRGKFRKAKNNSKITLNPSDTGTALGVIFKNKKTGKKELLYYGYVFYGSDYRGERNFNSYLDRQEINEYMKDFSKK